METNTVGNAPYLTLIVPIRITDARQDLFSRINNYLIDTELPGGLEVIVVDDGSSDDDYLKLKALETDQITVMRTGAQFHQDFSLARARNFAAQRARGALLMFMDADLVPYPGFFRDILFECALLNISEQVSRFLMVPVIYLTDRGYELMLATEPREWRHRFINAMLAKDVDLIEKASSGTSVIVVDRLYYLARGGQDIGFQGWGFEDYEFSNRLIRRDRRYPLPADWLSMTGNLFSINKFEGWKSVYRLYGDWTAAKGIYLFHAPHPIEEKYHSRKDENMRYLIGRMKEDSSNTPNEPEPLPALEVGSSLLLRSNPFCYDREFAPLLGHITKAHEDDFLDESAFAEFVRDHRFTRVVFGNPYANEKVQRLYEWCRGNGQPYLVCERGALPDSVYHDPSGFLNDSESYWPSAWDTPLTPDERSKTLSYIAQIRSGTDALEAQGKREDLASLRKRLGLAREQKVLFVAFQQPNDSVIRHFAGQIGSFAAFREEVERLALNLSPDWKIVYKKHPAEDDLLPIKGAVAAHDANVYDLLEICEAVAVINSGVGLLGMMFGKPVFVFGDAWYSHEGLCHSVTAGEDVAAIVRDRSFMDYEKVLRFVHYLRYRFYSFGQMQTRKVTYADGSPITATTSIRYYEIRLGSQLRRLPKVFKPISTDSPLFDRYKAAPVAEAKPSPKAAPVVTHDEQALARSAEVALQERQYAKAANFFQEASIVSTRPVSFLRMAAEAFDQGGETAKAIDVLREAREKAKNKGPIERRMRELGRPRIVRRFRSEKPYKLD